MYERLLTVPLAARAAALGLSVAFLVSGCVDAGPAKPVAAMERCFDQPLPVPQRPELPKVPDTNDPNFEQKNKEWKTKYDAYRQVTDPPLITMTLSDQGVFEGDKALDVTKGMTLKSGNVRVNDNKSKGKGSGFLTTAPDGSQVVVTAAHVVSGNNLSKITVTNMQDETVGVADGCYIYERAGEFVKLKDGEDTVEDIDLAILSLKQPLNGHALKLADSFPDRGNWVSFLNNQGNFEPGYPAEYNGLVVAKTPSVLGNIALTGVQPWRKDHSGGEKAYTAGHGASGGLVANTHGEVVGISYASSKGYWDAGMTESLYGVRFSSPVGNETGIVPTTTSIVDVDTIRTVLGSSRY